MQSESASNFFTRHWLGQNDLVVTLLGSLLVLRLALGVVQSVVPPTAAVPWIIVSACIMIWQVVGAFRTGDNALKTQGDTVIQWCLYGMMLFTVVLTVLQAVDVLTGRKGVVETATSVVSGAPQMLPVSNATTVMVEGEFNWDLRRAFLNTIEAYPSVNAVVLNSDGGLVFVGRALALTIAELGFSTRVEDRCHSACTIAFVAGKTRSIASGAKLGFHRYLLENENQTHGLSVAEELEVDRAHFAKNGVSESFLDQLFNADHSNIWVPDVQTLIDSGVLTP